MSWTDGNGVTHAVESAVIMTVCGEMVFGIGTPKMDDPPRHPTCLACVADFNVLRQFEDTMRVMERRGVVLDPEWYARRHIDPV